MAVAATTTVTFSQQGNSDLAIFWPSTFHGILVNFGLHDEIDVMGFHATNLSFANGRLTLTDASRATNNLTIAGSYKATDFTLTRFAGGSGITYQRSTPMGATPLHA